MTALTQFLRDPRNERTLLAIATAYRRGVGLVEHRWGNRAYQSKPSDGDELPFAPVIAGEPVFAASIDNKLSVGGLELINAGGSLDEATRDDFALRDVALYLGHASWALGSMLGAVFSIGDDGLVGGGNDGLSLALRDVSAGLDLPIETGITVNGEQVPVGFGTCFNVEPLFLYEDGSGAHYQINNGPVASVSAYRSGGLAYGGTVTEDLTNGLFILDPAPTGDLRCDVVFQADTGVIDLARDILTRSGVPFNNDSLVAWEVTINKVAGVFYSDKVSYAEALNDVIGSVGLRYTAYPAGAITLYRIAEPVGNPVLNLGTGNIVDGSLQYVRTIPPYAVARLGYRRNHSPVDASALFGTVSLADINLYSREWSTVTVTDLANDDNYPVAARIPDGDVTPTALQDQTDATGEANRRMTLHGVPVYEYRLTADEDFGFQLGAEVALTYPRFGFDAGVYAAVVGIRWWPVSRRCELTLWVWG